MGGFRTGELLGLEIRDLSFDEMGVRAKVSTFEFGDQ